MSDDPRRQVPGYDSVERAAWRSAVGALLVHADLLAAAASGMLASLRGAGTSLPENDPDRPLVLGVERFAGALVTAHASLQEVERAQLERERATPAAPAVN